MNIKIPITRKTIIDFLLQWIPVVLIVGAIYFLAHHSIEFWSSLTNPSIGFTMWLCLETSSIWYWLNTKTKWTKLMAVITTTTLLIGPLYVLTASELTPILTNVLNVISAPYKIISLKEEQDTLKVSLKNAFFADEKQIYLKRLKTINEQLTNEQIISGLGVTKILINNWQQLYFSLSKIIALLLIQLSMVHALATLTPTKTTVGEKNTLLAHESLKLIREISNRVNIDYIHLIRLVNTYNNNSDRVDISLDQMAFHRMKSQLAKTKRFQNLFNYLKRTKHDKSI